LASIIFKYLFDFNILSTVESCYVKDAAQILLMQDIHDDIQIIEDVA
jgi:hypothetical protein